MSRTTTIWTFVITSVALFMATLDNLVVTTSLPVIRADLGASIEDLEWTVNAYTLSFAVFLLTGAALGDRFGRRRLFVIGLGIFTAASVAAALAPSVEALIVARASGPLVGGAVVEGISWQWIFWLNVPIGLVLIPLAYLRLKETYGPSTQLDLRGLALASAGLFGIVWGVVRGNAVGWSSPEIAGSLIVPWTAMPIFVAPIAGALSDRIGGRPLMAVGLALQAVGLGWLAAVSTPTVPYTQLVPAFVVSGIGMALFFAPVANVVLSAVLPREEGQASGANNAIRELGGVFGVAVLASVFSSYGGYESGQAYVDGLVPAVWVGAVVVALGALAALLIPRKRRPAEAPAVEPELVAEAA
jgi:MFS family permease